MTDTTQASQPPTTAPLDAKGAKAEAKAAKARAKALRPWYKKKRFILSGIIVLLIILIAVSAGGKKSAPTAVPAAQSTTPTTAAPAAPAAQSPKPTTAAPTSTRSVTGTAVTLGAGTFTGGTDVAVGLYDVTPGAGESGNFIVTGTDTYDEILGGSDGVPVVRAMISKGDSIQISGFPQTIFTPVTTPLVTTTTQVTLYAGTWTVGEDLGPGRYVATPGSGQSGNFIVAAEGVDEILGGSDGVPNVTVNLNKGDVIEIGGLSQVTMTPA